MIKLALVLFRFCEQLGWWAARYWTNTWGRKSSQNWRKGHSQLCMCILMFKGAKISQEFQLYDQFMKQFQSTLRIFFRLCTSFTLVFKPDSSLQHLGVLCSLEGKIICLSLEICVSWDMELSLSSFWFMVKTTGYTGSWNMWTGWSFCGTMWGGTRLRYQSLFMIMMKSWSTVRWWTMD